MAEKVNHHVQLLEDRLAAHIPGARVVPTALPQCPELSLYLLNADYPQHQLDAQAMQGILNYPAYWAFCWASGQVLARYLLDHPVLVSGKTVLDFGCGSGVAALAARLAGAARVIACDIDPDARLATRCNARLNHLEVEVCGDFSTVTARADLILAADVLYDRENLIWLERFLRRSPRVLVADSRVRNFDYAGYRSVAQVSSGTIPDLEESAEFARVSLYEGQAD
ncbi:methyltransferase [Halieaceae bacterium IMCC14734]|uniref:Methyltransferase n=1 Tax=Candidatus Litorirhabdus singularis TaxID=2518993 RepID=A0ABT3THE0_9GAMM|nr:50S ribosomal protein L11 methyltransferase [Candidatus Litorirhabdus singularis]MCX2981151.1 methyltransferase [Candidatus Litorirhabdus singularis]